MCGIWFSIGLEFQRECIDSVAHRGPDGLGTRRFDGLAGRPVMAHRRLAIIDMSAESAQPMSDPTGRYWLTFNGQIYNYVELRAELEGRGRVFRSRGDAEVLLAAYVEWGEECLARLQGMFAFVIFDTSNGEVFAARDRFGIKPLYRYNRGDGIAFASEIKQFAGLGGFSFKPDADAVAAFLAEGAQDFSQATMVDGVDQLPAGHLLAFNAAAPGGAKPRRWYTLAARALPVTGIGEAVEAFEPLFAQVIARHLRSDVALGGCLSGGLDSGCIASEVARQRPPGETVAPPVFVTAAFAGMDFDEEARARDIARALNVGLVVVRPSEAGFAAAFDRLVRTQDEPFASSSIYAQYALFEAAQAEGLKVMLDGQGADEIMAGYHSLFHVHAAGLLRQAKFGRFARAVAGRRRANGHGVAGQIARAASLALLGGQAGRLAGSRPPRWLRRNARMDRPSGLDGRRRWMIGQGVLPALLHWEDRNSMAFGIESRVPFLDHSIAEFFMGLPVEVLYDDGTTKPVLRKMAAGRLPPSVTSSHRKIGFEAPGASWLRTLVSDPRRISGRIDDALPGMIDPAALEADLHALLRREPVDHHALFRAVCTARWLDVFSA